MKRLLLLAFLLPAARVLAADGIPPSATQWYTADGSQTTNATPFPTAVHSGVWDAGTTANWIQGFAGESLDLGGNVSGGLGNAYGPGADFLVGSNDLAPTTFDAANPSKQPFAGFFNTSSIPLDVTVNGTVNLLGIQVASGKVVLEAGSGASLAPYLASSGFLIDMSPQDIGNFSGGSVSNLSALGSVELDIKVPLNLGSSDATVLLNGTLDLDAPTTASGGHFNLLGDSFYIQEDSLIQRGTGSAIVNLGRSDVFGSDVVDIGGVVTLQAGAGGITLSNDIVGVTQANYYGGSTGAEHSVLQVGGSQDLTLTGNITASDTSAATLGVDAVYFTFTMAGTGTLTLSGTNNFFSGDPTVTNLLQSGTLAVGSDHALDGVALTISGGALQAANGARDITTAVPEIDVTGDFAITGVNDLTIEATVDLKGASRKITVTNTGTTTIAATIAATITDGGVEKAGSGLLVFTKDNTYAGGTKLDAGTLQMGRAGALGTGAVTFNGTGVLQLGGSFTVANAVVLSSSGDIDTNGHNATFSGLISGGGDLNKDGNGILTLTGAETYTGATLVHTGTLTLGSGGSLAASSGVRLDAGTTFDISSAGSQSVQILQGSGVVKLGGNVLSVGAGAYDGVIQGSGGLTKVGTGLLTLTEASTYTGATTVNAGALQLGTGGSLAASSGVGVASGALFDISTGSDQTIQGLSGAGIVKLGTHTLIEGAASSTSFSGSIQGSGDLVKQGMGILTLGGVNTYTGATTINAGTLVLGSGSSIADSSGVSIASGATLNLSQANLLNAIQALSGAGTVVLGFASLNEKATQSTTFSGQINGIGGLLVDGAANTFTLTGSNGYIGATLIQTATLALGSGGSIAASSGVDLTLGGILDISGGGDQTIQALSGTGAVALGGHTLTVGAGADSVFSGSVAGTGGLVKQGSGLLVLSGLNNYSGGTTVNAGILEVDGSLSTGAVTVNSGGALRGSGTVGGAVTVAGGAFLGAGAAAAPGMLTVSNDVTFQNGSTLTLRVTDASHYDSVHATGNVTIGTGTSLALTLDGGLLDGDTLTLLKSDGMLNGTFTNTSVTNSLHNALGFTTAITTTQGSGGEIDLSVIAVQNSFIPFAANGNQMALARVLDGVANDPRMAPLITALNGLPGSTLASAMTTITPVQQTTVVQNSLQASHAVFNTLSGRMSSIRSGSTGLSLNQFNWLDQNIPGSALIAGTDIPTGIKAFTPAPDNRWGFFAAANGDFGDIDGQTSQSNYHGGGFTIGSDYRLDPAFAVGFAVGYDYSKTDFDNSGSNSTANTIRFGPYATWKDKTGDWVEGTAGGAVHFYDSNRDGLGGMATSDATGIEFDSSLKYGHDFHVKQWTLTPTFGFDYLHLDIGKYSESGSLAPLTIQDQSIDSFRSNLGGTVAYTLKWKGIGWNPYVQAGWAHEFLDASNSVDARFASGAGDVFTTTGDNLGHDSATFGAGIQASLNDVLTVNFSYAGEANDKYQDHALSAAVRVAF